MGLDILLITSTYGIAERCGYLVYCNGDIYKYRVPIELDNNFVDLNYDSPDFPRKLTEFLRRGSVFCYYLNIDIMGSIQEMLQTSQNIQLINLMHNDRGLPNISGYYRQGTKILSKPIATVDDSNIWLNECFNIIYQTVEIIEKLDNINV